MNIVIIRLLCLIKNMFIFYLTLYAPCSIVFNLFCYVGIVYKLTIPHPSCENTIMSYHVEQLINCIICTNLQPKV